VQGAISETPIRFTKAWVEAFLVEDIDVILTPAWVCQAAWASDRELDLLSLAAASEQKGAGLIPWWYPD
jgi:hypothetical protein